MVVIETERLKEIDKTLEELNSCSETEVSLNVIIIIIKSAY